MKTMWIWGAAALIAVIAGFVVTLIFAIQVANQRSSIVAQRQIQTERVLIRSCHDNGNPLRMAVQQMLRDQIKQSHAPILKKAFPQIPPPKLHHLIRQANNKRRREIRSIRPVSCSALYRH